MNYIILILYFKLPLYKYCSSTCLISTNCFHSIRNSQHLPSLNSKSCRAPKRYKEHRAWNSFINNQCERPIFCHFKGYYRERFKNRVTVPLKVKIRKMYTWYKYKARCGCSSINCKTMWQVLLKQPKWKAYANALSAGVQFDQKNLVIGWHSQNIGSIDSCHPTRNGLFYNNHQTNKWTDENPHQIVEWKEGPWSQNGGLGGNGWLEDIPAVYSRDPSTLRYTWSRCWRVQRGLQGRLSPANVSIGSNNMATWLLHVFSSLIPIGTQNIIGLLITRSLSSWLLLLDKSHDKFIQAPTFYLASTEDYREWIYTQFSWGESGKWAHTPISQLKETFVLASIQI